jgi:hypothetical protein
MPVALILAKASEVCGMNNKPREVFLPKFAVTACLNEWSRGKHEHLLNSFRVHVGATVAPLDPFRHARTFSAGRTGLVLQHLYRDVTYCIAVELPESVCPGDFDLGVPVWAMQGSQLIPYEAEWHESGDVPALIEGMFRDHGRYTTGRRSLSIVMELETDGGQLVHDVYNPASRSKRLSRRVTRTSVPSVETLNWTPINRESRYIERSVQHDFWKKLWELCKADFSVGESFQLQHHGWNPYNIVLPKRLVELALTDLPEGRIEREILFGPDGFLSPVTRDQHRELSLREGGPHRITPEWSFRDQFHENQLFAHRKPPANPLWSWHLVGLKRPQMLQWVKEFAKHWGQQQENYGFLVQACQTYRSGRGVDVTGITQFLISLEHHSIGQALQYRNLVSAIIPAIPGNYIALARDPSRKKHRQIVFESLEDSPGIDQAKLFAHPMTKSKTERVGIPKLYRFGMVDHCPNLPNGMMHQGKPLRFKPFINNRGEGYVEVPEGNTP